jgi:hypothetical protein
MTAPDQCCSSVRNFLPRRAVQHDHIAVMHSNLLSPLPATARDRKAIAILPVVKPTPQPPRSRETRSISVRTRRSTIPGRLSSSQNLRIGRNISRTISSSVRAL